MRCRLILLLLSVALLLSACASVTPPQELPNEPPTAEVPDEPTCAQLSQAWFLSGEAGDELALSLLSRPADELRALLDTLYPAERAALGALLRRAWGAEAFHAQLNDAPTTLTADELADAQAFCSSGVVQQCFLLTLFDDVRNIDLGALMRYAPAAYQGEPESAEEWQAFYAAAEGTDWADGGGMPLCRYTRADVDALLSSCTAYTAADLRYCEEALYVPEYDAWYAYVSDIDWGTFRAVEGERWGEVLFLLGDSESEGENLRDRLLTLLCTDKGYQLIAFAACPL